MRQAAVFIASQSTPEPVWQPLVEAVLAPVRWWKRQRTTVRLLDLDDHILADIGIARDDVREVLSLPVSVNADLILQDRALTRAKVRRRGWRES